MTATAHTTFDTTDAERDAAARFATWSQHQALVRDQILPWLRQHDPTRKGVTVAALSTGVGVQRAHLGRIVARFPRYLQRERVGHTGRDQHLIRIHPDLA